MVATLSGDPASELFASLSNLALRFGVNLLSLGQGSLNDLE